MIRHAVGIDERRAKFRQDLVEKVVGGPTRQPSFKMEKLLKRRKRGTEGGREGHQNGHGDHQVFQNRSGPRHHRFSGSHERLPSISDDKDSIASLDTHDRDDDDSDETVEQDIEEVWFPGAHGDIGGGWDLPDGEEPLSHGPLVWMVRISIPFVGIRTVVNIGTGARGPQGRRRFRQTAHERKQLLVRRIRA